MHRRIVWSSFGFHRINVSEAGSARVQDPGGILLTPAVQLTGSYDFR
jgi:hypothetical protein